MLFYGIMNENLYQNYREDQTIHVLKVVEKKISIRKVKLHKISVTT